MKLTTLFVIVVYNILHQQQAVLPGSYPSEPACKAVLVEKQFSLGNWGKCEQFGLGLGHKHHVLRSRG
jgi:hypothetical protein